MPVAKNKPTTSSLESSTPEPSSNIAPDQEEFRKSLRRLAVSAVQVLIEQVMREELDESHRSLVGRMYAPSAVGTAMGPTPASLLTPTGRIEDLKV